MRCPKRGTGPKISLGLHSVERYRLWFETTEFNVYRNKHIYTCITVSTCGDAYVYRLSKHFINRQRFSTCLLICHTWNNNAKLNPNVFYFDVVKQTLEKNLYRLQTSKQDSVFASKMYLSEICFFIF